ncbi:hypothetical protein U1Q18_043138 [Sarracenia purpurea var. burkii]
MAYLLAKIWETFGFCCWCISRTLLWFLSSGVPLFGAVLAADSPRWFFRSDLAAARRLLSESVSVLLPWASLSLLFGSLFRVVLVFLSRSVAARGAPSSVGSASCWNGFASFLLLWLWFLWCVLLDYVASLGHCFVIFLCL